MGYVFGIDAGGSSTICAVADTEGKLVSFGQSGAANYKLVGVDASQKHIQEAIQIAQVRAGIGRADLAYGFYAVSGLDTDEDYNIIDRFIREITPTERYGLDNDAIASLILGSSRGCGVVIICGTGSNCIAVNEEGRRLQVGGLGREFGDFAGGREIALQAMAAAQRGFDGRGPATLLYDRIINYLGVESLADFSPILHYSARAYPIANLVPLVFSAAQEGDEVARSILKINGEELALSEEVAFTKLFGHDKPVEALLTGGVFRHDKERLVIDTLCARLREKFPQVVFSIPQGEPVVGSVIQALRAVGVDVSLQMREEMVQQMSAFTGLVDEFKVG